MKQSLKIFVAQPIQSIGTDIMRTVADVVSNPEGRPLTRKEFLENIEDADAVILPWHTDIIDEEALNVAKKLKVIGRHGVGYENIDVEAATRRGIIVTYVPVHTPTVADTAFGLLFVAARKFHLADRFVRDGKWDIGGEWVATKFLGSDVHHKTIGILGMGRIGSLVAQRAAGFDMKILYTDPVQRVNDEKRLKARRVEFEELLQQSDYISINCNLTADTRGLFNKESFRMMKKTAIIANTSRGPIIDYDALYDALRSGEIAGAGLDVFEPEPLPVDSPLLKLDNVVLTPHIGSATIDMRKEMARVVAEDVVKVLSGKPAIYSLNADSF